MSFLDTKKTERGVAIALPFLCDSALWKNKRNKVMFFV